MVGRDGAVGDMGLIDAKIGRWAGRRVLVTGAAGLLGRSVTEQLIDRGAVVLGLDIAWPVHDMDRPTGLTVVPGDVRDRSALEALILAERVDTVIHLAAQTLVGPAVDDPVSTFSHNVAGTWALLEACRARPSV